VLQRERPELVVLDPPRAGVGVKACELLTQIGPATIVYVSCDPNTLARDLAELQQKYRIRALHLFDLFPQTFHIETVVILDHTR
jgi:23S rRNA (uracil1939-C5)-methyltransferase